jgi:acylphosphatase
VPDRIAMRALVSGLVQGVGYRDFVRREAERLGVSGWVRNLRDGRVELQAEGAAGAVRDLLDRCRRGPPASRVSRMEAMTSEVSVKNGFTVLQTASGEAGGRLGEGRATDPFLTPDG